MHNQRKMKKCVLSASKNTEVSQQVVIYYEKVTIDGLDIACLWAFERL